MKTESYRFTDITNEELERYEDTDVEYVFADDVEKEIDNLQEELDDSEKRVSELENEVDEQHTSEIEKLQEDIYNFAIYCDQNNIKPSALPRNELEFIYERYLNLQSA